FCAGPRSDADPSGYRARQFNPAMRIQRTAPARNSTRKHHRATPKARTAAWGLPRTTWRRATRAITNPGRNTRGASVRVGNAGTTAHHRYQATRRRWPARSMSTNRRGDAMSSRNRGDGPGELADAGRAASAGTLSRDEVAAEEINAAAVAPAGLA